MKLLSNLVGALFALTLLSVGCGQSKPAPTLPQAQTNEREETQPHSSPLEPGELKVAAASDLKFAMNALVPAFQKIHPQIKVTPTFGASGNFFAQLSNDAPFDLFLSADIDYPRRLIEDGKGIKDSRFLYAVGHLVLWVRSDSALDPARDGIATLTAEGVNKIAIANPAHAPYGRAAVAALKSLGVYDSVESRLVLGENVAQAAQFVESGAADAGVFALSLAVAPELREKGRYWEIPLDSHPRLEQGGVILSNSKEPVAANAFRGFLISDKGRDVLKQFGFLLPGE